MSSFRLDRLKLSFENSAVYLSVLNCLALTRKVTDLITPNLFRHLDTRNLYLWGEFKLFEQNRTFTLNMFPLNWKFELLPLNIPSQRYNSRSMYIWRELPHETCKCLQILTLKTGKQFCKHSWMFVCLRIWNAAQDRTGQDSDRTDNLVQTDQGLSWKGVLHGK